jgi:alanine-glyoxylate transaminase/serine-glyoxylate transaminase/serine-pyruvate transaminase
MQKTREPGRHFLQIPGPTNVPDRILRAMDYPTMDHRGPAFGELGQQILTGLKSIFKCAGPVIVYPALLRLLSGQY